MHYTEQIREIAVNMVLQQKIKMTNVAKYIGANRHTVEDWVKIAKGLVTRKQRPSDRSFEKTKIITDFVDKHPDMSLLEMERELGFSDTNIAYHLNKAGYSLKKSRKSTEKKIKTK